LIYQNFWKPVEKIKYYYNLAKITGILREDQCDKGKEFLVQAWKALGVFRRQRLPGFKTIGTLIWQGFLLEPERRIVPMKNSNDTIGNRTRDLPARSAVPVPSAPWRPPKTYVHL
jgi:hypothetical protein